MKPGDRVRFTLYGVLQGDGVIVSQLGSPSDSYQFEVLLDDGRDFVATTEELELLDD